ncbi:hypothetical protein [Corynebacterium sp. 335C]
MRRIRGGGDVPLPVEEAGGVVERPRQAVQLRGLVRGRHQLEALMMLGDDRAIHATWAAGRPAMAPVGTFGAF